MRRAGPEKSPESISFEYGRSFDAERVTRVDHQSYDEVECYG